MKDSELTPRSNSETTLIVTVVLLSFMLFVVLLVFVPLALGIFSIW